MYKKAISLFLIASQMGLATGAFASTRTESSEQILLEKTLALTGEKLTKAEYQSELSKAVTEYANTAPTEGRQERMEKAMVDMNVYTAQQAHALLANAKTTYAQLNESNFATKQDASSATAAAIETLAKNFPMGAQYSAAGCEGASILMKASLITFVGLCIAGLATDAEIGGDATYVGNHNAWMLYGAFAAMGGILTSYFIAEDVCQ